VSQVFNSNDCRSTLVFVRNAGGSSSCGVRRTTGAWRGTSAYLGKKGSQLALYAKRFGVSTKPTIKREPQTTPGALVLPEAPRLYHGLPSSGDDADTIPVESTQAIHSIESELSALEVRLQRALDFAPRPTAARRHRIALDNGQTAGAPREAAVTSTFVARDCNYEEAATCQPSSRWDEFGRDSRAIERMLPFGRFLTNRYFRTLVTGLENLPAQGPCLLVANHSGSLPIDGMVLSFALSSASPHARHIRWLTEDFVQNLPFFGTYLQRLGAVRASRENVLRLFQRGECVVAFPEGVKGFAKPPSQFYRVQRLGRGRIIALCLEAGVPLLPCALVGGEEASPSLRRLEAMERWLGMPYFPITPTFPWLGPAGLLPAPSRWRIDIGPPFLTGSEPPFADDPLHIAELTNRLRTVLQERLDLLLAKRQSVWF
jgi:1-acyl-sn-glycerol-3-phosphate acyltransferase